MLLRKFLILELPEAASRRTHRRRSNSFTGSGARLRAHPIRRTMPRFALLRPRRYGSLRTRHARAPNRRCRIGLGEPHRQYRRDGFPAAHRRHRRTIAGPRRACAWPGLSVCVLPMGRVDDCVVLAEHPNVILATLAMRSACPAHAKACCRPWRTGPTCASSIRRSTR